ncbi:MAG: UxaA family hydrolase [Burkholderiaceae bacterium]|nr:UxaA family hydrolase [Burkholderiaceae bacterium]
MKKASGRVSIIVHCNDNVATLLDNDVDSDHLITGMALQTGVAMGHKIALIDIATGETITKYGVTIGVATQPISKGDHVHVHNCA